MSKQLNDLKLFGIKNREKYYETNQWYLQRFTRTTAFGSPVLVPTQILEKMELAAQEIELIRNATNFSQIQHLTIEF